MVFPETSWTTKPRRTTDNSGPSDHNELVETSCSLGFDQCPTPKDPVQGLKTEDAPFFLSRRGRSFQPSWSLDRLRRSAVPPIAADMPAAQARVPRSGSGTECHTSWKNHGPWRVWLRFRMTMSCREDQSQVVVVSSTSEMIVSFIKSVGSARSYRSSQVDCCHHDG